jgi:hypothetical protein
MTLHVYTAQRDWYRRPDALDLTRADSLNAVFAGIGTRVCSTRRTCGDARARYLAFLRTSYRQHRSSWEMVLGRSRVVLLCACTPGSRGCRRYVLADVFGTLGATVHGELRSVLAHKQSPRLHSRQDGKPANASRSQ